jgi:hypothetical protein
MTLLWGLAESAFGGSLDPGCRFCVGVFGRNLAPSSGRWVIALMMEAASTSEMSENFYQTTRRDNLEDSHLKTNSHCTLSSNLTHSHPTTVNIYEVETMHWNKRLARPWPTINYTFIRRWKTDRWLLTTMETRNSVISQHSLSLIAKRLFFWASGRHRKAISCHIRYCTSLIDLRV